MLYVETKHIVNQLLYGAILSFVVHLVIFAPDSPEHPPSILILGEAGSGKTTAIRDVCRKISAFEVRGCHSITHWSTNMLELGYEITRPYVEPL